MAVARTGVAFAGAGIVAEMHGRGIAATPAARLIGVFDPQQKKAKAIAGKFGGRVFRNLEELLSDREVEAVHVLTPVEHHLATALASLKAGKHVLIEKPVAFRVSEIQRLQKAARRANRACMPAHNYIYSPPLLRAKKLIQAGKLGRIGSLWVLYNIFHSEELAAFYGGVVRAVCIHHAYSLLYLLGRPLRVSATFSRAHYEKLRCEDQAMITCEMPGGAVANLWASFATADPTSDPWTVLYKVLGTRGGLAYTWNEAQFEDAGGPGWGLPSYEDAFAAEIAHFVDHVIRRGEAPLSTLADAADALRILEAAEQSARRRQSVEPRFE